MKWPRFTLRFLLVVVTLAAVTLGIGRRLFLRRPVNERQRDSVKQGMSAWLLRWQLGAPHIVAVAGVDNWTYGVEGTPRTMFTVGIEEGRVIWVDHKDWYAPLWFEK